MSEVATLGASGEAVVSHKADPRQDAKLGGSSSAHLDGVRGVLMFGVLSAHVFYASAYMKGPMPWYRMLQVWFQPDIFAVSLFVVISGYCLMLSVVRTPDGSLAGGLKGYLMRRVRRILPPYYVAAVIALVHIRLFPWVNADYCIPNSAWRPDVLLSHLLLYYNFSRAWRFEISGPYWSLAPEWQLYLLFAIALVPLWRRFGAGALLAATLLASGGLMLLGAGVCAMHPWFLAMFSAGMVAAVATTSSEEGWKRIVRRTPWRGIAYTLMGLFVVEWILLLVLRRDLLPNMPPTWGQYALNEPMLGLAFIAGIFHWSNVERTRQFAEWPLVLRVLNDRKVRWLGRFSYSHYLIHFPLVLTIGSLLRRLRLPFVPTLVLNYAISVPMSITVGYLFYLAVEKRCQPSYAKRQKLAPEGGAALAA